jgi:hypothetical protein
MESTLINTEGKKRKIKIENFEQARQIVCNFDNNSSIQIIILNDGTAMLLDENGKLKNYEFNEVASEIAHDGKGIYPSDYIVGDVLLVDLDEFDALPYE